jgi:mevalonate pyrophosphate decarboxylase
MGTTFLSDLGPPWPRRIHRRNGLVSRSSESVLAALSPAIVGRRTFPDSSHDNHPVTGTEADRRGRVGSGSIAHPAAGGTSPTPDQIRSGNVTEKTARRWGLFKEGHEVTA